MTDAETDAGLPDDSDDPDSNEMEYGNWKVDTNLIDHLIQSNLIDFLIDHLIDYMNRPTNRIESNLFYHLIDLPRNLPPNLI